MTPDAHENPHVAKVQPWSPPYKPAQHRVKRKMLGTRSSYLSPVLTKGIGVSALCDDYVPCAKSN